MEISEPEPPTEALDGYPAWAKQARVLSWLLYPGAGEAEARAIAAFKISMWRSPADIEQHRWAYAPHLGAAFPIDRRVLNGGRKRMEERLRKRIEAGHIALRRIQQVERALELGQSVPRWNLHSEFCLACTSLGLGEVKNYQHRFWEPSLPVLPMCAAMVAGMKEAELKSPLTGAGLWDVFQPTSLPDFLAQAASFENILLAYGLRFPAAQIVRLTLG